MFNYRYVSQGEFCITDDPNTILVTSGMTECIALEFVDKKNPALRLLVHLDGMILYNRDVAQTNIQLLIGLFNKNSSYTFDIYALGGKEKLRNYKILFEILEQFDLKITFFEDANKFCQRIKLELNLKYVLDASNANMTMICPAAGQPQFISYSPSLLNNYTEDDLIAGKGLILEKDREEYLKFGIINDKILDNFPDEAKKVRHSKDLELIKRIETGHIATSLVKLSVFNFSPDKTQNLSSERKSEQQNDIREDFSAFEYMW